MERPSGQAGSSQRRAASSMQKKQVHRRGGEETHMVRQPTAQPAGCGRKQDRCWQARKREIMASRGGRASHTEERGPGERGTRNKAARPATSRPAAKQGTGAGHQRERGRSAATAVRIMDTGTTFTLGCYRGCASTPGGAAHVTCTAQLWIGWKHSAAATAEARGRVQS